MRVEWTEQALDELAAMYVAAVGPDKEAIARATEQVNVKLAADPSDLGESRSGSERLWFSGPLILLFDVHPGGVLVLRVARSRAKG